LSTTIPDLTPQERLDAANVQFERLNRALPAGVQGFGMPPWTQLAASVDAVAMLLIEQGAFTEAQFIDAKTLRLAELMESMCEQVRELKRAAPGRLVIPHAGPRR